MRGMPSFTFNFDIAMNFSTIGRTLPGLQYMISRMSNMGPSRWWPAHDCTAFNVGGGERPSRIELHAWCEIGMSVAMFPVFRTVLVRRLPVVDQDRVVVMWTYASDPTTDVVTGTKDLSVVRQESRTMRDIAAVAHWPAVASPFTYGQQSIEMNRAMVTGNYFDVLGVRPVLGRLMRPSDDEPPGAAPDDPRIVRGLVLSYRAWQERFGGDSSVVGRHLVEPLLGTVYTIIGVAPPGFDYPAGADYWIPMWSGWQSDVSAFAVARLAPGATVAAARDEYLAIEKRLEPKLTPRGAHAATFAETVLGNVRPVLVLLTSAVA